MSEYTEALAELAALPRQLEERIERSRREVEAERARREREIDAASHEHREVVARLEAVLEKARGEGVDFKVDGGARSERATAGADPVEYARQLVGRLEEALSHFRYTRDALASEEAKLSEAERKRAAEERRRRERAELRRSERWEQARQGTVGLLVALGAATVAGLAIGLLGSAGVLALPVLAAAVGFGLAMGVASTLPALAVRRASGSEPSLPDAPSREARLGAAGYAAAMFFCSALGLAISGLAGGVATAAVGGVVMAVGGLLAMAAVWFVLPRAK
jgi:ABC-type multidrug transport system fused ATPase/permease subunit